MTQARPSLIDTAIELAYQQVECLSARARLALRAYNNAENDQKDKAQQYYTLALEKEKEANKVWSALCQEKRDAFPAEESVLLAVFDNGECTHTTELDAAQTNAQMLQAIAAIALDFVSDYVAYADTTAQQSIHAWVEYWRVDLGDDYNAPWSQLKMSFSLTPDYTPLIFKLDY